MRVYIGPYKVKENEKRVVNIRIDNYDVWNMDHTLALIIHPMLLKISQNKHGSPVVSDEDLPKEFLEQYPDGMDKDVHERWNYILSKMIYSFEHIVDNEWESKLLDEDYIKERNEIDSKIQEGLILFGKYFTALWT